MYSGYFLRIEGHSPESAACRGHRPFFCVLEPVKHFTDDPFPEHIIPGGVASFVLPKDPPAKEIDGLEPPSFPRMEMEDVDGASDGQPGLQLDQQGLVEGFDLTGRFTTVERENDSSCA